MPVSWDDFESVDEIDWDEFEPVDSSSDFRTTEPAGSPITDQQWASMSRQAEDQERLRAGSDQMLGGNQELLREVVNDPSQIPSAIKHGVMLPFGVAGQALRMGMEDIGQWAGAATGGPMPERSNLLEWAGRTTPMEADIPLPYQQMHKELAKSNPVAVAAAKFAGGTVEAAPMIAAGMPNGVAGRALSLMFAHDMAAAAGAGAGKIAGEMDRPVEDWNWDEITSGQAEVLMGAMAPLAAKHGIAPGRAAAPSRQSRMAQERMTPEAFKSYKESLKNQKSTQMTEFELEELYQLKQQKESGKLSSEDASRLEHLENKDKGLGHRLSEEEASYIQAEREAMGAEHGIEVVTDIEPGSPFSGQVATINRRTNKIKINPAELSLVLKDIPKSRRADYVKSLIAEESIHLRTRDADAQSYWDNLTWAEKQLVKRRYTGTLSGNNPHGGKISDLDFGHEAMRAQVQQIQGMSPTEIASTVGARRMSMQGLVALETGILNVRKALGTKASKEQTRILDEVSGKIEKAKGILQGEDKSEPASTRQTSEPVEEFVREFGKPSSEFRITNASNDPSKITTIKTGMSVKNVADLNALLKVNSEARNWLREFKEKRDAGHKPTPEEMGKFFELAGRVQFPREVIETATNTGSWVEGASARGKLGERPLDWQKNPEVESWLREHGKEIGIEIPESTPAAIRQGGPSKRGQEIAEQKRRIAEMQARARGEELPPELQTKSKPASFSAAEKSERPSTEAFNPMPRITAKDLETRAAQELSKEFKGADDRPSFEEFSGWAKRNMEGVKPEQLRDMWEDKVWSNLMSASGERLKQIQKALGITTVGRTPYEIRRGLRTDINIADAPGKPSFELELGIDRAEREAAKKSISGAQRHRNKVILAVARKLIGESVGGRAALERDKVGIDDIDFSNDKTKQGAYVEINKQDLADPLVLNGILRDQARGSSLDPESASKRLVAVVDSSGKVHLVSTFNDAGVQRVTDPAGPSIKNRPSRVLNKTFLNQYRPFASLLVTDPVRGFKQTFESVSEFMDKMGKEAGERSKVSELEPFVGEGPAEGFEVDVPLSGGGGRGIPGQEGYLMGPKKGEIVNTGQGALESRAPLTDAESRSVLNHIFDEVGEFQTAADVRLSLIALTEKSKSGELSAADMAAASAYRKIFNELAKKKQDADIESVIDVMADRIYEKYSTAENAEGFVKSIVDEFAPRSPEIPTRQKPETGARELTQLRDVAPTTVRGAARGTGVPSGRGLEVKDVGETPSQRAEREAFIKARSEIVGDMRPLSELLAPEAKVRAAREVEAAGGSQLSNAARRRAIEVERLKVKRKQGILPSYAQAERIYNRKTGAPEEGSSPGSIRQKARKTVREIPEMLRDAGSMYDSWMVDRIENQGGPVSKEAAQAFRGIIDREKQFYGELTPSLDKARTLAGASRPATGVGQVPSISGIRAVDWANQLKPVKGAPFAAKANVVDAIEGTSRVPAIAQNMIDAAKQANLEIGLMMQMALPKFKASGLFERNVTSLGYDIIRAGRGEMWNKWTAALARSNKLPIGKVRGFFRDWKKTLDAPDSDAAAVMSVHQDFTRKFKDVVTHIKSPLGRWEPVLHSDLFNYLENAARRATHARAFREVWPHNPAGRQDLATVMSDLRRELPPEVQKDVDAMMLTMQGHPTDNYSSMGVMGPTRAGGAALRMFNQTIGSAMAKMALTGQLFVQGGEALTGSTPVFLGYKNTVRAMARLKELYPQLEMQGAVNRVIYDFSLDRNSPIRSAFRAGGNVISKVFAEHALNEFQEATAAATAFVTAERIKSGDLSAWEKRMLPETFKAMGFTRDEVMGLMQGDANLLGQFQRKASAFLTSGNRAMSEGSRLGANRLFNSIFRFQSYPMMKANQLRRVTVNLAEAMRDGNAREKRNAVELFSRFLFGNTAQGAITIAITALAYQGIMGLNIKANEAADDPMKFLLEAYLSTISGPLYMAWRGYKSKGVTGVGENATRAAFPYTVVSELQDLASGSGRYKDLSQFDRIGEFLKSKTPGTKAISTGLAMAGLSSDDKKLDASIDAFYRWRRDNQGWVKREGVINDDERGEFRKMMKRAVEAMKDGDEEKFSEAYSEAFFLTDDPGSVEQSMRQRKVLKSLTGGDLSPEQLESLREHIGDEAVDRLEYFDLMIDEAAKGSLLPRYDD